jgi:tartrate-resistant acid phosphatase type 5
MLRIALVATFLTAACQAAQVPLPSHGGVVRLIVTGDAGSTHSQLRAGILALQKRMPIDGIVLAGDNFYPCGISSLNDPQWSKITQHFGPANIPIFAVLGNHDYGDPNPPAGVPRLTCGHPDPAAEVEANGKVPHWVFPARHYVVGNDLAELVMLDSQPIASGWSKGFLGSDTAAQEKAWLAGKLAGRDRRWRIVVGHHTMFSSGIHGRQNGTNQRNMRGLLPLLRSAHVDAYICGHDHDMEMLGDLKPSGGPLFVVSGAGSGLDEMQPRTAAGEPRDIWSPMPRAPFYGFALLEISRSELAVTFYDAAGNAASGRLVRRR